MAWASEKTTGSAVRKAVLYSIANHANKDGLAVLRIETICEEAEVGSTAAKNAVTYLTDAGMLARKRKRRQDGTLSCYEFQLQLGTPSVSSPEPRAVSSPEPPGVSHEPGRPSEPVDLPPTSPPAVDERSKIVAAWKSLAPPLIEHRESYFAESKTKASIDRALRTYPVEAVIAAVENYAAVLDGDEYRWDYRWTIVDFIKRGLDRFVPEADPLRNFRVRGERFGRRDVSSREFRDAADRLKDERENSERRELESG